MKKWWGTVKKIFPALCAGNFAPPLSNCFRRHWSHWKIHGDVNIFQIHAVIEELIRKMTEGLSDNVKLQIILKNDKNDQVNQTGLLNKTDMIAKLADWVILFIDYHDMDIEDITIKLLKIKIPTGCGPVSYTHLTLPTNREV